MPSSTETLPSPFSTRLHEAQNEFYAVGSGSALQELRRARHQLEIVLAGLRGDRTVKDVCREHEIAETLYYVSRDKLNEGEPFRKPGASQ